MADLIGDSQANTLDGTAGEDNTITGRGGDDELTGADLADTIYGGSGNDTIAGGTGSDLLVGGLDDDTFVIGLSEDLEDSISGGSGNDTLVLTGAFVAVGLGFSYTGIETLDGAGSVLVTGSLVSTIDLSSFGQVINLVALQGSLSDETLIGSASSDTIYSVGGDDLVEGGAGADFIFGGDGEETFFGGSGADSIVGGDGRDQLDGGGQADTIEGRGGIDAMSGGRGGDWIVGGRSADILRGAAGADRFVYGSERDSGPLATTDVILDFAAGTDLLDLLAIDAIAGGADDAFTWLGNTVFTGNAGELIMQEVTAGSGNWFVLGDTDGDANADLRIRLDALGTATLFGDADILN
jgi:Ca2+-binding RTX toxin-like protein